MVAIDFSRRINGQFRIVEVIGVGFSSKVCRVKDLNGKLRAAKFVDLKDKHLIEMESKVMDKYDGRKYHGVPYWHYKGEHGSSYVLVMDLLGNSIANCTSTLNGLSLKSVLMIGIQLIHRIEKLHTRGYIHRDIKPDNILIGYPSKEAMYIYLIDFGHAKEYKSRNDDHKPKTCDDLCRNAYFASVHASRNLRQSRRCDLESLLYCLIYLLKGALPWNERSLRDATRIKERITAEELCDGLPGELSSYFEYVRSLGYSERPEYSRLVGYLEAAIKKQGLKVDNRFEWMDKN